ncbi:MAG: ABC transporter ATP-binding protein [Velocimicrobium sp.]
MNDIYIEIKELSKQFQEKLVLSKINMKIEKGEILGLLGPSGAGKTTLIKILTGQIKPSSGEAYVFGKNVSNLDQEVYQKIGMVLDNAGLYERLTTYDNLVLFAEIYGLNKKCIQTILARVDLSEAAKREVMHLSKGMKQRLVLARAMMHEPKLLFLDEPTSGLDPGTAAEIHKLVNEQKKKGTTIFLTTHNMEEAEKLCDHVALLHAGRIIEYGVPDALCRKYNNQNQITIRLKSGEVRTVLNSGDFASEIAGYFEQDMVESIHSSEPNLETVFMELTGRGLV